MIKIANAPVSWGVIENVAGQRITYGQVLDEIREAGYTGTELGDWGFMPTDPPVLKAELDRRELELIAAFVPVALADPESLPAGIETALRTARLLLAVAGEAPFIVLADDNGTDPIRTQNAGRIRPEHGMTEAQWQAFTAGAERLAERVRAETGLRTAFHHHCAGYIETPDEVDRLMSATDPELLGLCFDTGHYRFGGGNPLEALRRHGDRIWHVHFKDCDPSVAARSRLESWAFDESIRHGIFCELGDGDVDFQTFLDRLKARGYEGWIVVEQDVLPGMGSPRESARRSRKYLRRLGV